MLSLEQITGVLPAPLRQLVGKITGGDTADREARSGALAAFSIRVASAAIAFLSHVALARWMGSYDFGIYTYVWVCVNVIGTLCALGFSTTAIRFFPEYLETGRNDLARGFLRTGRSFSFGAGLVCTAAGLAVLYFGDGLVADYYRVPLAIGLTCLPAFALTDFQDGVGRAHSWIDLALVPPYILRPFLVLGLVGTAAGLGWSRDAETAVLAAVIATWATACVQYLLQKRRMLTVIPGGKRSYQFGFWLSVSLPALVLESFSLLMLNLDVLLLDLYVSPDQIAIYFAAARTISLIAFVHFAVAAACMPRFARFYAAGDPDAIRALLVRSRQWTFVPSLVGAVLVLLVGKPVLWLFGPEFTVGYPVMLVLVLGLLARAAAGPAQGLLVVTGRHNITAAVMATTVALNIALNLALIPKFGLLGAAAATGCAFAFEALVLTLIIRRTIHGDTSKPASRNADGVPAE